MIQVDHKLYLGEGVWLQIFHFVSFFAFLMFNIEEIRLPKIRLNAIS